MPKFCHSCGKQTALGAKFCSECGTDLSSLANLPPTHKQSAQFTPFAVGEDDDDDASAVDRMTHFQVKQSSLQVEIGKSQPIGETIGSLISQGLQSGPPAAIEEVQRPVVDNKQVLQDFRKEASTLRPNE